MEIENGLITVDSNQESKKRKINKEDDVSNPYDLQKELEDLQQEVSTLQQEVSTLQTQTNKKDTIYMFLLKFIFYFFFSDSLGLPTQQRRIS